jgi:hypothetical protein
MTADADLSAFLDDLARAGTKESQGEFSVDLRRSVAKLSELRYQDPENFLRHIFSAAAALGATTLSVQTRRRTWSVYLEGARLAR